MDLSHEMAKIYASISFNNIPSDVVDISKRFILDTIGVALAGWYAPGVNNIFNLMKDYKCSGQSSIMGIPQHKFNPMEASFMNSVLCHALDFDDTMDDAATHSCVTALSSALSLGEGVHASGRELITAVVLGIDTVCRLSLSSTTPLSWIRTATCGTFGSTVAAGKILKLDEEKLLNALGIAYSQASGNAQCLIDGALSKKIQPAFATRAGVFSALLAKSGITGAREVFEGKFGFFNLYEGGKYNRSVALDGLGDTFMVEKLSMKPYPTCRMTHSSIDASLKILRKMPLGFNAAEIIEKIEIWVCKMSAEMVGRPFSIRTNPQVDAQFSIPYNVSVVFTKKEEPFIDDIGEETIKSHKWDQLVGRISVYADNSIDSKDIHRATIRVTLKNGEVIEESVDKLRGSPENPLSWEECITKFKRCASLSPTRYTERQLDRLITGIMELENVNDVACLLSTLYQEDNP